ncbi:MAG: hypothetical protein J5706_06625 [Elusimicrobiales bacterium]|nr:hypothetical protein [Elusimicrobiales bacterium]
MLHCRSKYYRTRLSSDEDKSIYDKILSGLANCEKEIKIRQVLSKKTYLDINKIVGYVRLDNPGLFYVDFSKVYYYEEKYLNLLGCITVSFSYKYTIEDIRKIENILRTKIADVAKNACKLSDQYKTELVLHDWLALNVNYDDSKSCQHYAHEATGPLLKGRAVCEGYALAFKLLCDAAGISNIVVFGDVHGNGILNDGGHAWNIVKINGRFYHIDVTWDSCVKVGRRPGYAYFNITDSEIMVDHSWENNFYPSCSNTADNYYVVNGILFKNRDYAEKYVIDRVNKGQKSIIIKVKRGLNTAKDVDNFIEKTFNSPLIKRQCHIQYSACHNIGTVDIVFK